MYRRSLFQIEVSHIGDDVEADLIGELDISGVASLEAELAQLLQKEQPETVTLDCTRLAFIDVVGLDELIHLAHLAERRIILLEPPPVLTRMLGVTGLDRLFTVAGRSAPASTGNADSRRTAGGPLRRMLKRRTALGSTRHARERLPTPRTIPSADL